MDVYIEKLEASQNVLQHVNKTLPNLKQAKRKLEMVKSSNSTQRDRAELKNILEELILSDYKEEED